MNNKDNTEVRLLVFLGFLAMFACTILGNVLADIMVYGSQARIFLSCLSYAVGLMVGYHYFRKAVVIHFQL